jgi:hypothetical protein
MLKYTKLKCRMSTMKHLKTIIRGLPGMAVYLYLLLLALTSTSLFIFLLMMVQ